MRELAFRIRRLCIRVVRVRVLASFLTPRCTVLADPALKVKIATLNGTTTSVNVTQDNYGFRMQLNPTQMQSFSGEDDFSFAAAAGLLF